MIAPLSIERDLPPSASLDFGFNYAGELATGETISSSMWAITSLSGSATADITLSNEQISGATTSVFVSGGVRGTVYVLVNYIETSNNPSRKFSRHLILSCKMI